MSAYLVEFMEGNAVTSSVTVAASSAFKAAGKASREHVTFEVDRAWWIRVTPSDRQSLEFGYAKGGHRISTPSVRMDRTATHV